MRREEVEEEESLDQSCSLPLPALFESFAAADMDQPLAESLVFEGLMRPLEPLLGIQVFSSSWLLLATAAADDAEEELEVKP